MRSDRFDIESARFIGESQYAQALRGLVRLKTPQAPTAEDATRVRRALIARSLLLSEGMAPSLYQSARAIAAQFEINEPIEIYQAAGAENAAMHLVPSPVLLEVRGRLLALLDANANAALIGHEFGHYLAHGAHNPLRAESIASAELLHHGGSAVAVLAAQRLSMAQEITADRVGLLACGSLEAALRLEMVVVTGLAAETLTWDTQAYIEQSRMLMEGLLAAGEQVGGDSHPEHSLRAWALWLFSETDRYHELTGMGSATRTLADIDQLLLRVLGRDALQLGVPSALDEPLMDVHECALAACVLMANADGEFHELEMQVIERVFSPLVADWRERLDHAQALIEFQRLAPLVYAAGPGTQRALFALLSHMLAIDGECNLIEIDMLLAIGKAIGCHKLFTALLTQLLVHFSVDISTVQDRPGRSIPMPARSGDVHEALHTLFSSAAKRASTQISMRRLLSIMGLQTSTPEAIAQLNKAAASCQVLVLPEFGKDLSQLHILQSLNAPAAIDLAASAKALPADDAALHRALMRLRDKLVSGDGRSPAIRLNQIRAGRSVDVHALEQISVGLSERVLALIQSGKRARVLDAADVDQLDAAKRYAGQLVTLERERALRFEETGADDLYLGYPFVTGIAGGYLFRAPVLLQPVRIESDPRRQGALFLHVPTDAATIINQSAIRLIFQRKNLRQSDETLEALDALAVEGSDAVLAKLRDLGLNLIGNKDALKAFTDRRVELSEWRDDRLELENCAVLGLFPQSNSDLLQDYDELLSELAQGANKTEMFASAMQLLPSALQVTRAQPHPAVPEPTMPLQLVSYADPVQQKVLDAVRHTPALVLDGPPGTGKSQVIVNVIADALARGQRVAVVCEKRAALDVVAQRLEAVGLRHLLAVVHDIYDDRKPLFQQIQKRFVEVSELAPNDASRLAKKCYSSYQELSAEFAKRAHLSATELLAHAGDAISLDKLHIIAAAQEAAHTVQHLSKYLQILSPEALSVWSLVSFAQIEAIAECAEELFSYADIVRFGSFWHSSTLENTRRSFAAFDAIKARTFFDDIERWRMAAFEVETLLAAAGLPNKELPNRPEILVHIHALAATLAASQQGRSARDSAMAAEVFCQQLYAPEAQLRRSNATPAWRLIASLQVPLQEQSQAQLFAQLLHAGAARPEVLAALPKLAELWREHASALLQYPEPVQCALSPALREAMAVITAHAHSMLRWLQPAWYRARKVVRSHLITVWPEVQHEKIDGALISAVQARSDVSLCWSSLTSLWNQLGVTTRSTKTALATKWVEDAAALGHSAHQLASQRGALQALQMWPELLDEATLRDWQQKAPEMLEEHALATRLQKETDALVAARAKLEQLACWPGNVAAELGKFDRRCDALVAIEQAQRARLQAAQRIATELAFINTNASSNWIALLLETWRRDASRIAALDRNLAQLGQIEPLARAQALAFLADQNIASAAQLSDALRWLWSRVGLQVLEQRYPDITKLTQISRSSVQQMEQRLPKMAHEMRSDTAAQIKITQDQADILQAPQPAKGARRNISQARREAIQREASKQRNVMPLRAFVRKFWNEGLMDVLPVWLLSPETAAVLFPRQAVFDLVVFDEASQCTVENGFPVLIRGKRALIAGDDRQMPPSNFFKSAEDTNDELSESVQQAKDVFDAESLLVLARQRVPHQRLAWHYRCQQEELIAFSNHAIYQGSLKTIPAPQSRLAKAAIYWTNVPDGVYDAGGNLAEARVVIDTAVQILRLPQPQSIGIVTFNLVQRRIILDEIDRRIASDANFAELWANAATNPRVDERPFVKNIESVQGDERDVIIFSLGHAPVQRKRRDGKIDMYVPARFGPLGQRGGERRLNVAISRAKQAIHIIASFTPHMLSVAQSKHEGPRLFKGFLLFAHELAAGQRNQAEQSLRLFNSGPTISAEKHSSRAQPLGRAGGGIVSIATQLVLALEERGIKTELAVGTSDFRVPIAVLDPNDPTRYALGILIDYEPDPAEVFERVVHIPNVLHTRGWNLLRISAREWDLQREQVLDEIAERVRLVSPEPSALPNR